MTPIALTPPAAEPVSLDEAKLFLRLDHDEEDQLLGTLITAARLVIEAASGRIMIDQSWRIILDRWPAGGEFRLPLSPVASLIEARVYDPLGIAQPVAAAALALDKADDPPLLHIVGAVPEIGRPRAAIEIDVVAGFGATGEAVPAPLRQAVLRLTARWFELRGDVVSRDAVGLPAEIRALVAPFRRARI